METVEKHLYNAPISGVKSTLTALQNNGSASPASDAPAADDLGRARG